MPCGVGREGLAWRGKAGWVPDGAGAGLVKGSGKVGKGWVAFHGGQFHGPLSAARSLSIAWFDGQHQARTRVLGRRYGLAGVHANAHTWLRYTGMRGLRSCCMPMHVIAPDIRPQIGWLKGVRRSWQFSPRRYPAAHRRIGLAWGHTHCV